MKKDGIILEGYEGKWYVIAEKTYHKTLYLVESEIYGDETPHIIIDEQYNVILDDVWNGFDDYREAVAADVIHFKAQFEMIAEGVLSELLDLYNSADHTLDWQRFNTIFRLVLEQEQDKWMKEKI